MGLAVNGQYYGEGWTYFDADIGTVEGFVDNNSFNYYKYIPGSVNDFVKPGAYVTNLDNLRTNFFDFRDTLEVYNGHSPFKGIDGYENIPVAILVPRNNLTPNDVRFPLYNLCKTQLSKLVSHSSMDDLYYKLASGAYVPLLPVSDLQYITFSSDSASMTDVDHIDYSSVQHIFYKGKEVEFYVPNNSVIVYIGGYGFSFKYPTGYVFMALVNNTSDNNPKKIIGVYDYDIPEYIGFSGSLPYGRQRANLGYKFYDQFTTDGKLKKAIIWSTADSSSSAKANFSAHTPYITFDVPYNPNIHSIFGGINFDAKIDLTKDYDFNNIGKIRGINGAYLEPNYITTAHTNYDGSFGTNYLPQGIYIINKDAEGTYKNAPVGAGMYSINVFSAGNGSMIQQVLTDPGVAQYNKYTRSWSVANGAYGSWSGTYQI